jgi:hypothetical protein
MLVPLFIGGVRVEMYFSVRRNAIVSLDFLLLSPHFIKIAPSLHLLIKPS